MLSLTELVPVEERLQSIRELIEMVDAQFKDSEEFHNLLRSLPYQFFNEWVSGTAYSAGDVYTRNGMKYLVIKDTPASLTTDPSIFTMREYSLPYQGVWANLWAFKEPVIINTIRYPYQSTTLYRAKQNLTSAQNTAPPEEAPNFWEVI